MGAREGGWRRTTTGKLLPPMLADSRSLSSEQQKIRAHMRRLDAAPAMTPEQERDAIERFERERGVQRLPEMEVERESPWWPISSGRGRRD